MSKDRLEELIGTMSTVEKRYFKQYLGRYSTTNQESKYAKLFDAYNQQKGKRSRIDRDDKNLKSRLYAYVLKSLRSFHSNTNVQITLMQNLIDYEILHNKGLFDLAGKVLQKSEQLASLKEEYQLLRTILQKQEYLWLVRLKGKKSAQKLKNIAVQKAFLKEVQQFLFDLQAYHEEAYNGFKTEGRISRNPTQLVDLYARGVALYNRLETVNISFKAHQICFEIARVCLRMNRPEEGLERLKPLRLYFYNHPEAKQIHMQDFVKYLNLTSILFNELGRYTEAFECITEIRSLWKDGMEDEELRILIFETSNFQELEMYVHQGQFQLAVNSLRSILPQLEIEKPKVHNVNLQSKQYRVALAYFGNKQYQEALKWVNINIQYEGLHFRTDILASIEILNLMCHLELGHQKLLVYLIPSAINRMDKYGCWGNCEKLLFKLIGKLNTAKFYEKEKLKAEFIIEREKLSELEKQPLAYFDLTHWLR